MNKKIKKMTLTFSLIHLLQSNNYALAKDKSYSNIFDNNNITSMQYGANQGDFVRYFSSLIKDTIIWEEVQKYFPIENFESEDEAMYFYRKYFTIIYDHGCGYVGIANSIFNYFNGREDEFYQTFGFPMYVIRDDATIDYNYEILVLKFFNYVVLESHASDYCLEDIMKYFEKDFYSYKISLFLNNPDNSYKKPDNYGKLSKEERQAWRQSRDDKDRILGDLNAQWFSAKNTNINLGLPISADVGDVKGFLKRYNIDVTARIDRIKGAFKVNDIISGNGFTLYKVDENDNIICKLSNVSSHYLYVSDITEDGKVIVSSWGEKYICEYDMSNEKYRIQLRYK